MRPHALPLALGLILAALHSAPALAQDASPDSSGAAGLTASSTAMVAAEAPPPAVIESDLIKPAPAESAPVAASSQLPVQTDSATALSAVGVAASAPIDANAGATSTAIAEASSPQQAPAAHGDDFAVVPLELDLDYSLAQVDPPAPPSLDPAAAQPIEPVADPRTAAERDFDDIYGNSQAYDPVADPTLPAPANVPGAYDPWEKYNRRMHRFNMAVDKGIARPLARAYTKVVPRPIRLGVSNFFNNLGQPVSALNALLQGKPKQAAQSLGRFALNTTLGIAGIFDPASDAKLPNRSEDFGQTLGIWGWKRSRYLELPLFGPRTVRDAFGALGDAPLSPLRQVDRDRIRIPLQGLQLVDVRAQLLPLDSLREGAEDEYALVRDSWTQRRDYQIFGDRMDKNSDEQLPDYLQDDSNPSVPADAMPVMPTDGGR
ncbi:MlaA family lipoprotein [Lysobacter sp. Root690]|uniref:MlaA family lipoprotein n=1 Tax=Lysobacter sp. Root690 TaxID=1736588 RepID=UPI000A5526D8